MIKMESAILKRSIKLSKHIDVKSHGNDIQRVSNSILANIVFPTVYGNYRLIPIPTNVFFPEPALL